MGTKNSETICIEVNLNLWLQSSCQTAKTTTPVPSSSITIPAKPSNTAVKQSSQEHLASARSAVLSIVNKAISGPRRVNIVVQIPADVKVSRLPARAASLAGVAVCVVVGRLDHAELLVVGVLALGVAARVGEAAAVCHVVVGAADLLAADGVAVEGAVGVGALDGGAVLVALDVAVEVEGVVGGAGGAGAQEGEGGDECELHGGHFEGCL